MCIFIYTYIHIHIYMYTCLPMYIYVISKIDVYIHACGIELQYAFVWFYVDPPSCYLNMTRLQTTSNITMENPILKAYTCDG